MSYKICTELQVIKENFDKNINLVENLPFRQKDVIRQIEFYTNSRYLNGQKDELGREKPFFNVLNAICDVENAAKDIDTKDITATSDDGQHYTESFIMTKDIYEWMKATNFAKTLNDMRDTHTRYGSVLAKKVMKTDDDGKKLHIEIPEWKNILNDQIDIKNGVIVEVHYMTPMQMIKMTEWENVQEAIEKVVKEGSGKRIPVYEVRGEFPKAFIKELQGKRYSKKDETSFSYQLYYLAGEYSDEKSRTTNSMDFSAKLLPLYWEDDTEKVYKYLARKPRSGRSFGVGVLEEGSEAQVWTNDAVLKQYRAMEYTSKFIGQTASKKLKGRNTLTEVDDGQILEHEDGKPITPVNMMPSGGLNQYQNLIVQWYNQLEKTTSAYAAQRGETPPSGTPFRLQATVLQQSSSVFVDLQEELGIFITELFTKWIMPHLARQLNTEHILAHEFSLDELKEIDENFGKYHANEISKQLILSGKIVSPDDYAQIQAEAKEMFSQTKTQRFLKIPKDYYKKFKAKITVNVTGEQRNKATILESLINIMTVYAQNPMIAQDPVLMQIFLRIVELSGAGISPVSLIGAIKEQAEKQKQMMAMQAQGVDPNAPQEQLSLAANPQAWNLYRSSTTTKKRWIT